MLHSLCLHHLCWIVKRLLSSDNFFREAEPETTRNNWIVVGVAFLGWTLWLAFRALLYLLSFGVCESHCDKNFKKSRFHWLSRQFLFTELLYVENRFATEELHPDAPDLQPGLETQGKFVWKKWHGRHTRRLQFLFGSLEVDWLSRRSFFENTRHNLEENSNLFSV